MIIQFDGVTINNDLIYGVHQTASLFNQSFQLGRVVCKQYELKVDSSVAIPTNVSIDGQTLIVYSYDTSNKTYNTFILVDKIINLNKKYDYSQTDLTVSSILTAICENYGFNVPIIPSSVGSMVVSYYSYISARDFIGYVCELCGKYAYLDGDTLVFSEYGANTRTISLEDCADITLGEKHKITRVFLELGAYSYQSGTEEGETIYLNPYNVLFTDNIQSQLDYILSVVQNMEFYSLDISRCLLPSNVKVGDFIEITDGTNTFKTFAQIDWDYDGEWIGGFSCNLETTSQEESTPLSNSEKSTNRLEIKVDRENATLTQTISQTNTRISEDEARIGINETNISNLTQTSSDIQANFSNYVRRDDNTYQELTTNITFNTEGINIASSNVDTNLQMSATGVNIRNGNTSVASMEATQFTTGQWVMAQDGNVFNIFKKG